MVRTASASPPLSSAPAAAATRLAGLRAWMERQDLEAAYVTRPVSIAYLTGVRADPHERLMALAVRHDGATLIVPALEQENATRSSEQVDIVAWRDGEDPYELVRTAVGGSRRLGVEKEHLTVEAAEALSARAAVGELVDIAPEIRKLRLIKGADELEKIARACAITDEVTEEVMQRMRAGQSELAIALEIGTAIAAHDASAAFEM